MVMPFLTDLNKKVPILVISGLVLVFWFVKGGKEVRLAILLLIPTILLSDQLSSSVVKFMVERPRPCHVLAGVHLLVPCGSGYSFPSSHAVNNFAGALVLSYFMPRTTLWWFSFASTVAFSRVYVGVHYPTDVLGGAVIGLMCAVLILAIFEYCRRFLSKKTDKELL